MTELEPVRTGAVAHRDADRVVVPERWPAARPSGGRSVVARGVRALATRLPVPVPALMVTAAAVAAVVVRAVRTVRDGGGPAGGHAAGRGPGQPAPGPTVLLSWTHVELRAGVVHTSTGLPIVTVRSGGSPK